LIGNLLNIYTAGYTAPQVYPVASKNFMPAAIRPSYSVLSKSKIRQKLKVTIPEWDARLTQLFPFLIQ
jgi:dTDP-4-dehydrorhamnose reductase